MTVLGRRSALGGTVIIAACLAIAASGCSSGGGGRLHDALGRVQANAHTEAYVEFGDSTALRAMTGSKAAKQQWIAVDYTGTSSLAEYARVLPGSGGIDLDKTDYAISAGLPPYAVSLLAGGQDAGRIAKGLRAKGWSAKGDLLTAPPIGKVSPSDQVTGGLTLVLARVQGDGSDLRYGSSRADLGQIGQPSGDTLADNPRLSALADCLGDVSYALITTGSTIGHDTGTDATGVAVGYQRVDSAAETPHAIVCTTWPSDDSAAKAARSQAATVASGRSAVTARSYASLYKGGKVDQPGGDEHVVRLKADTPGSTRLVVQGLQTDDLPGLCGPPRNATPQMVKAVQGACHK